MAAIGEKKYGTRDVKTIFTKAKDESIHYFKTEEDILNYNLAALNRVKAAAPKWFEIMPKADGIV